MLCGIIMSGIEVPDGLRPRLRIAMGKDELALSGGRGEGRCGVFAVVVLESRAGGPVNDGEPKSV